VVGATSSGGFLGYKTASQEVVRESDLGTPLSVADVKLVITTQFTKLWWTHMVSMANLMYVIV